MWELLNPRHNTLNSIPCTLYPVLKTLYHLPYTQKKQNETPFFLEQLAFKIP